MRYILLLLVISSCRSFPKMPLVEKCKIDLYDKKCTCVTYEVAPNNIGPVDKPEKLPMYYCDDLTGFKSYYWTDVEGWFYDIFDWLTDIDRMAKETQ